MLEYKLLLLLTSANYQIPLSPWVVAPFAYSVQSRNFLAVRDVWTMSIQVSSLRSPAWAPALLTPNLPLDRRFPPSLTPAPSCTHLASGVQSGRRGGAYRCPAGLFVPSSGWGCPGQRLLSLWADHLNVDSLGFASRSLQGSKGVHLSPISHQVCSCCGVALTAQVAFFWVPEGWPFNTTPSKGSTPPSETRILAVTAWWRVAPPGLSAPGIYKLQGHQVSAGLAGQSFQKETITLNTAPSSNAFGLPEMRMGGPSEKPPSSQWRKVGRFLALHVPLQSKFSLSPNILLSQSSDESETVGPFLLKRHDHLNS